MYLQMLRGFEFTLFSDRMEEREVFVIRSIQNFFWGFEKTTQFTINIHRQIRSFNI